MSNKNDTFEPESTSIGSSLGRMPVAQGHRRTIVVDEPEEDLFIEEEPMPISPAEVQQMRKPAVSPAVKKRAEILANLGRATAEVKIEGITFSLRTLKQQEVRATIKAVADMDLVSEQAYEMRTRTLANAIYLIDNQPVDLVIGDLEQRIEAISNMDETIVSHLYRHYNDLNAKHKIKYNLTEEEANEVAEDIKKS